MPDSYGKRDNIQWEFDLCGSNSFSSLFFKENKKHFTWNSWIQFCEHMVILGKISVFHLCSFLSNEIFPIYIQTLVIQYLLSVVLNIYFRSYSLFIVARLTQYSLSKCVLQKTESICSYFTASFRLTLQQLNL